jgi:hypothetical protein
MGGRHRSFLAAAALLGLALPGAVAARPGAGPPAEWAPPTPAEGKRFTALIGKGLAFSLAATAPGAQRKPRPKPKNFVLSSRKRELYRWAFVIRPTVVRAAPRRTSAAIAQLGRWTPEGTSNLVLTLDGRRTSRGVWIRVRLPIHPANRTGWVKRKALSDWKELRTRLVVDRRRLSATLFRGGKVVLRAPVGVGQSHWPTPRGEFYIRNQLYGFGNAVYGPVAFGTSARSAVLTDWPGGGFIGIHGTNQPHILPGRVSHGCIRMKNGHILRLARLMPIGTPLTVR